MLEAKNLSLQERQDLEKAIKEDLKDNPPTIGLVGISGVGKSTTINTLFKTELPISHTKACTKEFKAIDLHLTLNKSEMENPPVRLRVIDAPGLGEDIRNDPVYLKMYHRYLPICDVILWVISATNRGIALDQQYLKEFSKLHEKMVFGLNQVDLVEPMNWNKVINLPSEEMEENISEIEMDRLEKLSSFLNSNIRMISYSAKFGFNLEQLFTLLIDACPANRRWIFDGLKNFSYTEFIPDDLRRELSIQIEEQ